VEFRILGSLEAVSGGRRLRLGGSCEHRLLAALLLDADQVVPVARLAESIWDDPPATAAKQVRNRVSRLRRMLAAAEPGDFIVTDADGYRIAAKAIELDARRFQAGVTRSHQAASAGRTDEAAEWLRSALALWRGPALSGLGGRSLQAVAAAWDERRCAAMETYYGYQLQRGRHREVLGELAASATAYPFREKLAGQYMLALYRCGVRADALAAYRATQALLAEEMGLDPGPELRQLHQQMLRDDPALALARQGRVLPRDVPVVPRQLPAFSRYFAGRAAELSTLTAFLERGSGTTGAVILVIEGMAGIGKTALAVHWAHQAAGQFPDGQLHLNLRGFDASVAPVTPAQAVRILLDSLAVPPEQIPASLDAQAALYRSLLAGRRVLVVLDNARDASQVRSLLPGSPSCMTVVTSRNHLSGLIIAEGADPLVLGPLSNTDARQLMAARIGHDRVAAEHPAADAIIALCRRLPLALSVVAARAAAHPGFSLDALARELRDSSHAGLDALDDSNATVSVRAAFSWSCQQLSTAAARLFRLLGLHPGPDITAAAAASLAGLPSAQARRLLAELACSHLITEHQPGRFTTHELLRAYAAEQAHRQDSHAEQRAAVQRMLDHYLHTTYAASQLINPHPVYEAISPGPPGAGITPESLADDAAANAWLGPARGHRPGRGNRLARLCLATARVPQRVLPAAGPLA
jgi:DNA-binding SARP family transcriptional activator